MLETLQRRPSPSERPHRRRGLIVLLILVLLLVGAVGAAGAYYQWATGASGPEEPFVLTIPRGATGADVAELLAEREVIRSPQAFRLMARFRGFAAGFQAGRYRMRTNLTVMEALDALREGPFVETVPVTFPEGLTVGQTAQRAQEELGVKASSFLKLARSGRYEIDPYLPAGTRTLEGFLYPSTYDFLRDVGPDALIRRMLGQFEQAVADLPWDNAKRLGVTPYEVVVVASMIEREARVPEDRAKVAAVIHNRLERGMPLQIDATVQYALGKQKPRLTYADLEVDSPYNTYLHPGLPPTPIASPGLPSLEAALSPARADYLYFVVVDEDGRHAFTSSYDEFLRLKREAQG